MAEETNVILEDVPGGKQGEEQPSDLNNDNNNGENVVAAAPVIPLNPYAYLERNEFTSERFKIEVRGLPKYYGIGEFKKLLNDKLKLSTTKLKPPARGSRWIYICFRTEEDKKKALEVLSGYNWKNSILSAQEARAAPDPLVQKRSLQLETDDVAAKKVKLTSETLTEMLKKSTTPWWDIPYEEQVNRKLESMRQLLTRLGRDMVRCNPALGAWLKKQQSMYSGLPCELLGCRSSPQQDSYRNKCEFTIGKNPVTGEGTVGFRVSSYAQGSTAVGPVDSLIHIPQRMKLAGKVFEQFVRSSKLPVFEPEHQSGHWRQLTCRLSMSNDQLMLVVGLHPQQLSADELNDVKTELKEFFMHGGGKDCNVTSLYFQLISKRQAGTDPTPPELLMGASHIEESICGVTLRISPEAFFQVNSAAAEVLYGAVEEVAQPTRDTSLLDVCCGSGAIGLCLAKKCGQVLGVELITRAVEDARTNASINSVENCEFFSGAAEEILSSVIRRATYKDLLAVVDPPRAGLHQKAIKLIRRTEALTRMVFLSCDPQAARENFLSLSRPASKTYWGDPIVPVRAVAVDMFPHTPHCELIIYFERYCDINTKPVAPEDAEAKPHVTVDMNLKDS
ncbi:tRNA (uracil-5-)-methyltransferase homolog A-like [Schistocerca nitens]|uniref:tRNA (uracil-5-)-methyltransferase homolog A-like n=1 Tax=Schistocerca nitens TaxID=7011 RepID=UPI002118687A|nr:tRNA (uracil-5-)-methyltransferase homolog A-like [Schistocerca nitens]XP_049792715.1 tRNA (uracil-5-)-methyltransferase homolog A-like [Schistocerca nitens]XP_049792716.1 tRNA (uracil-5-)-methyltransferase homolog A-like [Schistocerca nitens]